MTDPTLKPHQDPLFTPPVSPPDLADIAATEAARYPEIRRNAVRWQRLEKIMRLAEQKRGKALDPMLKQWLMSVVEPQEDETELFLPANGEHGAGPEKISTSQRKAQEDAASSQREAKKRSGVYMTNLFESLENAKNVLNASKIPDIDTTVLAAQIESVLAKEDEIQTTRLQIDEASYLALEAFVGGKTRGDVLNAVTAINKLSPSLDAVIKAKVPAADYAISVDQAFVDDLFAEFQTLITSELESVRFQTENILLEIASTKADNDLAKKVIDKELGRERRAFNSMFGGTDAETILNFATVNDNSLGSLLLDITILEAELSALGWNEGTQEERLQEIRNTFLGGRVGNVLPMSADEKQQLLVFVEEKLTKNPTGFSLNLLNQRVEHSQILREWTTETLSALRGADGNISVDEVKTMVSSKFPPSTFPSIDAVKLLASLQVDASKIDTALTPDQTVALSDELSKLIFGTLVDDTVVNTRIHATSPSTSANLSTAFGAEVDPFTDGDLLAAGFAVSSTGSTVDLVGKELAFGSFIRGKQVKKITGKDHADVKISQLIKDYGSKGASLAGAGIEKWAAWIASLPQNVSSQKDPELLKLLNAQRDLDVIKDALSGVGTLENGAFTEGSLLSDVGGTMDRNKGEMEIALREEARASSLTKPTKDFVLSVEHATELADVGEFVLKELQDRTCFETIKDPVTRHRAFLIAMYYGIGDANLYMRNPESYELTNQDKMTVILSAEKRYLESLVAQGDLLGSLKLYGLDIDPRAMSIMSDTLIPGTCDSITLDCPADGTALALILREGRDPNVAEKPTLNNPDRPLINKLIRVYTQRQDENGLTVEEAQRIVDGIRLHLAKQDADAQALLDTKTDHRFDPLTTVNSAYQAVKGMITGDTFAEKALGWALIGGTAYGIIKAWPKHWKLIMSAPMLLGANVALKRMTGKSAADYLNLQFMDEKHRNTSYEEFIRRNRFVEGFEEVEEDTGRAAMSILTDDTNPIPIEELLYWRKKMKESGPKDFAEHAPKKLQSKLRLIIDEMGTSKTEHLPYKKQKEEALRIALLAFQGHCVDVDRARGLGGSNLVAQEEAGAEYIRRMYTSLNPDCQTHCPDPPPIVGICGIPPCKCFTMRHTLTFERPSEALMKPLDTWTETILSKGGIGAATVAGGMRNRLTALEIRKNKLEEEFPEYWDWAKVNVMETLDSFSDWARVSYAKMSVKVPEDLKATWLFLRDTTTELGLQIKVKGPALVEWTYDAGAGAVKLTKDSALALYRGLKKKHISGPILIGLEEFIAEQFDPVDVMEFADLTNVEMYKKSIIDLFANKISAGDMQVFLDKIMGATLLNIEAEPHLPSRALKLELLKRSLYSYLIASRMQAIEVNPALPNIQTPLHADFSALSIDKNTYKLTGITNPNLADFYNHVFTHYDPKRAGILIGQDRSLGIKLDEAAMHEGVLGTGAAVINWFGDNVLWDTSGDYLKGSLAVYLNPVMKEAKESLTPEQAELFRSYVETLLMNVVVEMTLSDEDPNVAPLHLTVKRAKEYLTELQIKRGGVPEKVIDADFSTIEKALKLYEMPRTPSDAVEYLRRDPVASEHLGAGLGRLATLPHAPSSTPSSTPSSPTSPSTGPAAGPAAAPAIAIDPILAKKAGDLTPDDQAKLLQAYPTAGSKQGDIEDKFDALLDTLKGTPDLTPEGRATLLNAFAGVSDSYYGLGRVVGTYRSEAEELFLERFKTPADLEFVAREYSKATDPDMRSRLLSLAKRSLGARLSETFVVAQTNPSEATFNAQKCLQSAQNLDSLAKDKASMLMEYIFCKGDYTTRTIDEYKGFVRSIDYSGAEFRFSKGLKLSASTFETYFDALK